MKLIIFIAIGIVAWCIISGLRSRSKGRPGSTTTPHGAIGYRSGRSGRDNHSLNFKDEGNYLTEVGLVEKAIHEFRNIEFMYRKPTETNFNKRVVKPTEILTVDHRHHEGSTLCVRGFCHLRKEERTFAFKRMQQLRIQ